MKIFNTLKGIKLLTFVFLFSIVTTILAIVFSYKLMNIIELVNDATEKRNKSLTLAYELKQSSTDLSKFARLYVETKHPRYKYYYYLVSDIRDGYVKKPEKFIQHGNFFWDINMNYIWELDNHYDFTKSYPLLIDGYLLRIDDNPNSPNFGNEFYFPGQQ